MKGWRRYAILAGIMALTLCFAGCGSSPPSRFYALSSMESKPADRTINADGVKIVAVGPIEIPPYLARQEIVTRTSRNVLSVAEFDLWGGPLEDEIGRVLVENISILLAGKGATAAGWRTKGPVSYKMPVSFIRFDAQGETLTLIAQWSLTAGDSEPLESGRESFVTKRVAGKAYTDVAASMSEALADLSAELAAAVKTAVTAEKTMEKKK